MAPVYLEGGIVVNSDQQGGLVRCLDEMLCFLVMTKTKRYLPDSALTFFRAKGREGGKVGGKLRWKGRTAAEKATHARLMVAAREAKKRAAKGKRNS
jgi:hypothetical protein